MSVGSDTRTWNFVTVEIQTESGCDWRKDEYGMRITGVLGSLELQSPGGSDDVSLIRDCIENNFDFEQMPAEGIATVVLRETGEREDVFWNKYYVIEHCCIQQL